MKYNTIELPQVVEVNGGFCAYITCAKQKYLYKQSIKVLEI